MPKITTLRNLYPGVNAHLHSTMQQQRHWKGFHGVSITHMMEAMRASLRLMGYTADNEESLQIHRIGEMPVRRESDILIRDVRDRLSNSGPLLAGAVDLEDLMEGEISAEHSYAALLIAESETQNPVAWVEILSPTNKGDTKDALTYLSKRGILLERGLVFVEIDYLHETPPTFGRLPDYSRKDDNAKPYRIVVIDPRPKPQKPVAYPQEFDLADSIPVVDIPLLDDDIFTFDFGATYQETFRRGFYGDSVDYAQIPPGFDTYSPDDQRFIARVMLAAQDIAARGGDLETAELELADVTLEEALARLKAVSE